MMTVYENFQNRCGTNPVRVRFSFGVSGSNRVGVLHMNMNVTPGGDIMDDARKAARIVCKRAGAETAELMAINKPDR